MTYNMQISVEEVEGRQLNGQGMVMLQYLEQNLAAFEYKVEEGFRIRCRVSVAVDKGIAVTSTFMGERIILGNGVSRDSDLYLKSSYLHLTKVLAGKANPIWELLKGNIRLGAWQNDRYRR